MQHRLEVYIAADCSGCNRTKQFIADIMDRHANLEIDLLNLSNPDTILPDIVFATPTYVLDGRVIFLGNPSLEELNECFREAGVEMIARVL